VSATWIARLKVGTLAIICLIGSYFIEDNTGIFNNILGALGIIFLWASAVIVDE
jgi:hypothetical protein